MTDTEMILQAIGKLEAEIGNIKSDLSTTKREIATILEEQTDRLQILIETEVTQKINALFDGYSLDHEKQTVLETRTTRLEKRVDVLEIKVS